MTTTKVVHDVATRWGSAFAMLEGIRRMKPALLALYGKMKIEADAADAKYKQRLHVYESKAANRINANGKPIKPPVPPAVSPLIQHCPSPHASSWTVMEQLSPILCLASELSTTSEGEYYPILALAVISTLHLLKKLQSPIPPLTVEEKLECITEFSFGVCTVHQSARGHLF